MKRPNLRRLAGAMAVTGVLGAALVSTASAQTAPDAVDDAATVAEDQSITINVLANDTPTGLTIASVATPSKGTAAVVAGGISYTPKADFNGTATFSYTVTNGTATDSATVTVTVTPVNDAPVAKNDEVRTTVGTAVQIDVLKNDHDVDSETLTPVVVTQPANGTATVDATTKKVTYTPQAGFIGTNTFTYHASDGALISNIVTVTVQVKAASTSSGSLDARVLAACQTVGTTGGVQALCRLYLDEQLPAFVKVKLGQIILKQTRPDATVSVASICARTDNSVRIDRLCEVYEGDLLPASLKKQIGRLIIEAATGTSASSAFGADRDDDDRDDDRDKRNSRFERDDDDRKKPGKSGSNWKPGKPWNR